ncbi:MAG: hypothetical protein HY646_03850 [Acidobacteria bacterium]|nr:hypothetical protein [Acidobacteriota bacterium]
MILRLHDQLMSINGSAVVALNPSMSMIHKLHGRVDRTLQRNRPIHGNQDSIIAETSDFPARIGAQVAVESTA